MLKKGILLTTSIKLFNQNGFNASGINEIIKEANVSKMTLYKYFKTKDDLIVEALEQVHQDFIKNFINKINTKDSNPKNKIIDLFDMLSESAQRAKDVRCIFINASAEFPDKNHPAHKAAFAHKLTTQNFFEEQLKELKKQNPEHIARILTSLTQGALVMTQIGGDKIYYDDCKKAAQILIK